jgi:hypothetical protein
MNRTATLLGPLALAGTLGVWTLVVLDTAPRNTCAIERAIAASRDADQVQCRIDHGPDAVATQLPDGSHRCTDRAGKRLARSVITIPAHQLAQVRQ